MKLDDDKEAIAILNNGLGAYGNRARAIYNKGYKAGFEDGKRDAIERLMDSLYADRKTEPSGYILKPIEQTEPQTECGTCETYWNCQGQCDEMPQIEDEPQTEVDWKDQMWAEAVESSKTEPQTERSE